MGQNGRSANALPRGRCGDYACMRQNWDQHQYFFMPACWEIDQSGPHRRLRHRGLALRRPQRLRAFLLFALAHETRVNSSRSCLFSFIWYWTRLLLLLHNVE